MARSNRTPSKTLHVAHTKTATICEPCRSRLWTTPDTYVRPVKERKATGCLLDTMPEQNHQRTCDLCKNVARCETTTWSTERAYRCTLTESEWHARQVRSYLRQTRKQAKAVAARVAAHEAIVNAPTYSSRAEYAASR
jgi:hypothetical protein